MQHRDELTTHKDIMVLKPDRAKYKQMEDANALFTLAILDEHDKIVGYSVNILTHALHYSDLKICMNDILFLRKDLRKGSWGIKLIKETERLAKIRLGNPAMIMFHGKQNTAFSELMPRIGYAVQDIIFSKEL